LEDLALYLMVVVVPTVAAVVLWSRSSHIAHSMRLCCGATSSARSVLWSRSSHIAHSMRLCCGGTSSARSDQPPAVLLLLITINMPIFAGQLNRFTHLKALLVFQDRSTFWLRQLASLGKRSSLRLLCCDWLSDSPGVL
jgi:hypothetical protein